jgi:hypothetical protein
MGGDPLEDDRVKAVGLRAQLPPEMLAEFRAKHPTLDDEEVDLMLAALRQWNGVERRNPGGLLPSRAVCALEELRGKAPRMFVPDSAPVPHYRRDPSLTTLELQTNFNYAFMDDSTSELPLLFRVDEEVRWPGGLSYRGACTRKPCEAIDSEGRICLHLGGSWSLSDWSPSWGPSMSTGF